LNRGEVHALICSVGLLVRDNPAPVQ